MVRTQIYLTEGELDALDSLALQKGRKRSEIIREAIGALIDKYNSNRQQKILDKVAGMWSEREELPDFSEIRQSLDRTSL